LGIAAWHRRFRQGTAAQPKNSRRAWRIPRIGMRRLGQIIRKDVIRLTYCLTLEINSLMRRLKLLRNVV